MKINQFLDEIRDLVQNTSSVAGHGDVISVCTQFQKVLVNFLKVNKTQFEAKLAGLKACLENYVDLRKKWGQEKQDVDQLGHCIFMESARLVLDIEFHQLEETEEPRASFKSAIGSTYTALQEYSTGHLFLVLQWLMVNYWSHPTLVAMMQGEELEEERALTYLRSGEYPELFKLRIEMLVESGCESHALNLCNWCVKSPVFSQDIIVRQTQLLLLHKFGRQAEFHNQCWQVQCCSGVKVIDSLFDQEEKQSACLMMAQTFLLQDWMQPKKYCCTKDLLNLWMLAQRLEEQDDTAFLNSVRKVVGIAKTTRQLVTLVAVMTKQFGTQFLQFCSEVSLKAMKLDRQMLDTARVKKIDEEANRAADALARTCRQIAETYSKHCQMCLGSLLTALYLDPKDDLFFKVERHFQSYNESQQDAVVPPGVEPDTYKELFEMLELLRPGNFHPKVGWDALKRRAIFHLEEGGYKYLPAQNRFESTEEKAIAKHQAKMKSKPRSQIGQSKKVRDSLAEASRTVQGAEISVAKVVTSSQIPGAPSQVGLPKVVKQPEHSSQPDMKMAPPCDKTAQQDKQGKAESLEQPKSTLPEEMDLKVNASPEKSPKHETPITRVESKGETDQETKITNTTESVCSTESVDKGNTSDALSAKEEVPSDGTAVSVETKSVDKEEESPKTGSKESANGSTKPVKGAKESANDSTESTNGSTGSTNGSTESTKNLSAGGAEESAVESSPSTVEKDTKITKTPELSNKTPTKREEGSDSTKKSSTQKTGQCTKDGSGVQPKERTKVIPPPLSGVKVPVGSGSTPLDSPSVGSVTSTPTATDAGSDFIPGMGKFVEEAALLDDCDLLQHISDFLQGGTEVEGGTPEVEEKGTKTPSAGQTKSPMKNKSGMTIAGSTNKNWKVTKEGPAIWQNRFQKSRNAAGPSTDPKKQPANAKTSGGMTESGLDQKPNSTKLSIAKGKSKKIKSANKPGPKSSKLNTSSDGTVEEGSGVPDAGSDHEESDQGRIKFECQFCKKAFNSMAERRRHQEWMCSKKEIAKAKEREKESEPTILAAGAKTCKVCRKSFYNYSNLVRHIRNLHKDPMEAVLAYFGEPKAVGLRKCSVDVMRLNKGDLDKYNIELPEKSNQKPKEEPPKYKRPQTAKRSGAKPLMKPSSEHNLSKSAKDRNTRQKFRINYSEYFSDLESASDWSSEFLDEVSEDTEDYYGTTTTSSESEVPVKRPSKSLQATETSGDEEDDETGEEFDLVVDMDALKNLESELEGEGPFLCDGCANVFDNKESLLKHECNKNLVVLKNTPEKKKPSMRPAQMCRPRPPNMNLPRGSASPSRSKGPICREVHEAMSRVLSGALQKSVTRVYDAVPEVEDLQKENIEEHSTSVVGENENEPQLPKSKSSKKKKPKPKSPVRDGGKSPGKEGVKTPVPDSKETGGVKKKKVPVDKKTLKTEIPGSSGVSSGIIATAVGKPLEQPITVKPLESLEVPVEAQTVAYSPDEMTSIPEQQEGINSSFDEAVTVASEVCGSETIVPTSSFVNAQGQTIVLSAGDQLQFIQNGIPVADNTVVTLDSSTHDGSLGTTSAVQTQFQPEESGLDILSQALQLSDVPNHEGEADYQMQGIFPLNEDPSQVQLTNFVQDSQGIVWQTQTSLEVAHIVDPSQTYVTASDVTETNDAEDKKKSSKKKKKRPPAETVSKAPGMESRSKPKSPIVHEPPGGLSSELQEMIHDNRVWITYRDCVFYKRLFIECTKCQEKFPSAKECQVHQDSTLDDEKRCIPDEGTPANKKKTVFYCRNCDQAFTTRETVVNHMNGRCTMPTKTLGPEFFKYKCEHCGKGFCTQASMHAHVMSHKKDEIRRETRVVEKAKESDRDKLSAQMDMEFSHLSKHEADILKRAILSTLGHELEKQAAESEKEENKKSKKKKAHETALDTAVEESFEMDHYEESEENNTEDPSVKSEEKVGPPESISSITIGDSHISLEGTYVESAEHELMVDTEVQNVLVGQTISLEDSQQEALDVSNQVPLLAIATQDSLQSADLPPPVSLLPHSSGLPPVNMLFTQPTTSLSMQYSSQGSFLPRPIMSTGFQFTSTVTSHSNDAPDSLPAPAQAMAQGGFLPQPIMSISIQKSPIRSEESSDESPKKNDKKSPGSKSKKIPRTSSPRTIKNLLAAIAAEKQIKPGEELDDSSEGAEAELLYGQHSAVLSAMTDDSVVSYAASEASDSAAGDEVSMIRDLELFPDMSEPGELKAPVRKRRKAMMLNGRKVTQHMETTMYFTTCYVCGGCKEGHEDKKTYKQHAPECPTGTPAMKIVLTFYCFYCNESFERKKFCRNHMLKECPESKHNEVAPALPKAKPEKNVPCTMCSKKFSAKRWLYQHMIRNHELEKHVTPPEKVATADDLENDYMVNIEKVPNPTYEIISAANITEGSQWEVAEVSTQGIEQPVPVTAVINVQPNILSSEGETYVTIVGTQDPNSSGTILHQTTLNPSFLTSQMSTVLPVPASPANSDGSNASISKSQLPVHASGLPVVSQVSTTTVVYTTATQPTVTVQSSEIPLDEDARSDESGAKNGVIEYKCDLCQKLFVSENLLTYHQKYICAAKFGSHNKAEEWRCKHCKATFHHKVALKFHMRKCDQGSSSHEKEKDKEKEREKEKEMEEKEMEEILPEEPAADVRKVRPRRSRSKSPASSRTEISPKLRDTLVKKTMMHADIPNMDEDKSKWIYMCKYCQKSYNKVLSLHSHVLSLHSAKYAMYKMGKDRRSPDKSRSTTKKPNKKAASKATQIVPDISPETGSDALDTSKEHDDVPSIPISEEDLTFLGEENVDEMISVLFAEEHEEHSGSVNVPVEENTKELKSMSEVQHVVDPIQEPLHANYVQDGDSITIQQHVSIEQASGDIPVSQQGTVTYLIASDVSSTQDNPVVAATTESYNVSHSDEQIPFMEMNEDESAEKPNRDSPCSREVKSEDSQQPGSEEEENVQLVPLGTINQETAFSLGLGFSPCQSNHEQEDGDSIIEPDMQPDQLETKETSASEVLTCTLCAYTREFEGQFSLRCHMKWVHGHQYSDDEDGTKYGDPRILNLEEEIKTPVEGDKAQAEQLQPETAASEPIQEQSTNTATLAAEEPAQTIPHVMKPDPQLESAEVVESNIDGSDENETAECHSAVIGNNMETPPADETKMLENAGDKCMEGSSSADYIESEPSVKQDGDGKEMAKPSPEASPAGIDAHGELGSEELSTSDSITADKPTEMLSCPALKQNQAASENEVLQSMDSSEGIVTNSDRPLDEQVNTTPFSGTEETCGEFSNEASTGMGSSKPANSPLDSSAVSNNVPDEGKPIEDSDIANLPAKKLRTLKARRKASAARMRTRGRRVASKKADIAVGQESKEGDQSSCKSEPEVMKSELVVDKPEVSPNLPEQKEQDMTIIGAKVEKKRFQSRSLGSQDSEISGHVLNERPRRETRKRISSEPQEVSSEEPKGKISRGTKVQIQNEFVASTPRLRSKTNAVSPADTENKVNKKLLMKTKTEPKSVGPQFEKEELKPKGKANLEKKPPETPLQTTDVKRFRGRPKKAEIKLPPPSLGRGQEQAILKKQDMSKMKGSKEQDSKLKTGGRISRKPASLGAVQKRDMNKSPKAGKVPRNTRVALREAKLTPANLQPKEDQEVSKKLTNRQITKAAVQTKKDFADEVNQRKMDSGERRLGKLRVDLKTKTVAIIDPVSPVKTQGCIPEPLVNIIAEKKEGTKLQSTKERNTASTNDSSDRPPAEAKKEQVFNDRRFSLRTRQKQLNKAEDDNQKKDNSKAKSPSKSQDNKKIMNQGPARRTRVFEKQPIVLVTKEEFTSINVKEARVKLVDAIARPRQVRSLSESSRESVSVAETGESCKTSPDNRQRLEMKQNALKVQGEENLTESTSKLTEITKEHSRIETPIKNQDSSSEAVVEALELPLQIPETATQEREKKPCKQELPESGRPLGNSDEQSVDMKKPLEEKEQQPNDSIVSLVDPNRPETDKPSEGFDTDHDNPTAALDLHVDQPVPGENKPKLASNYKPSEDTEKSFVNSNKPTGAVDTCEPADENQSSVSLEKPLENLKQPSDATVKPPAETSAATSRSSDNSDKRSFDQPSKDNEKPCSDTDKTMADDEKSSVKPFVHCDNSSKDSDKPSVYSDRPSENSDKPPFGSNKPLEDSDKFCGDTVKPSIDSEKPSDSSVKPSVNIEKPLEDSDQQSIHNENTSVDAEELPIHCDKPSEESDKSSVQSDRSLSDSDKVHLVKSSEDSEKPSIHSDKSSDNSDRLSVDINSPSGCSDKSSVHSDRPSAHSSKQPLNSDKPLDDSEKPSVDEDKLQNGCGNTSKESIGQSASQPIISIAEQKSSSPKSDKDVTMDDGSEQPTSSSPENKMTEDKSAKDAIEAEMVSRPTEEELDSSAKEHEGDDTTCKLASQQDTTDPSKCDAKQQTKNTKTLVENEKSGVDSSHLGAASEEAEQETDSASCLPDKPQTCERKTQPDDEGMTGCQEICSCTDETLVIKKDMEDKIVKSSAGNKIHDDKEAEELEKYSSDERVAEDKTEMEEDLETGSEEIDCGTETSVKDGYISTPKESPEDVVTKKENIEKIGPAVKLPSKRSYNMSMEPEAISYQHTQPRSPKRGRFFKTVKKVMRRQTVSSFCRGMRTYTVLRKEDVEQKVKSSSDQPGSSEQSTCQNEPEESPVDIGSESNPMSIASTIPTKSICAQTATSEALSKVIYSASTTAVTLTTTAVPTLSRDAKTQKVVRRRSSLTQAEESPKIVHRRSSLEIRSTSSPCASSGRSATPSPLTLSEQPSQDCGQSTIISVDKATGRVRVCSPITVTCMSRESVERKCGSPLTITASQTTSLSQVHPPVQQINVSKSCAVARVKSPVPQSVASRPASEKRTALLTITTHKTKNSSNGSSVTKTRFNLGTATKIPSKTPTIAQSTVSTTTCASITSAASMGSSSAFSGNVKTYSTTSANVQVSVAHPPTRSLHQKPPSAAQVNFKPAVTAIRHTTFSASSVTATCKPHGCSMSKPVRLVRRSEPQAATLKPTPRLATSKATGKVGLHKTTDMLCKSDAGDLHVPSAVKQDSRSDSPSLKNAPHVTVDSSKIRTNLISQKYPWSCAVCGDNFEHRHLWSIHLQQEHGKVLGRDHDAMFDQKPLMHLERIEKMGKMPKCEKSSIPNVDKERSTPSPTKEPSRVSSGLPSHNNQSLSKAIDCTQHTRKPAENQDSEPDQDSGCLWSSDDDSPRIRNKVTVSYSKAQPLVRKELEFDKSLPGMSRSEREENRFDIILQKRSDSVESDRSVRSKASQKSTGSKASMDSEDSRGGQCSKQSAATVSSAGQQRLKCSSDDVDATSPDRPFVLRNRIVKSPVLGMGSETSSGIIAMDTDDTDNSYEPAASCSTRRKSNVDEGPRSKVLKREDSSSVTDEASSSSASPVQRPSLQNMEVDSISSGLVSKHTRHRLRSSESGTDGESSHSGSPTRRLRSRAGSLDGGSSSQDSHSHIYNTRRGSDSSLGGKVPSLRSRTPTPTQLNTKDAKHSVAQRTRKSSQSQPKHSVQGTKSATDPSIPPAGKPLASTRSSGRPKASAH